MKLFFLVITTLFITLYHADGIAEYHYYLDQDYIILKFEMDQNELRHYRINIDCPNDTMADFCTSNYLLSQTDFKINGKVVAFELKGSSIYNGHVILNFKSNKRYELIKEIQIKNSCFYELNAEFKNRARIEIKGFQKSFLLTKGKEVIYLK